MNNNIYKINTRFTANDTTVNFCAYDNVQFTELRDFRANQITELNLELTGEIQISMIESKAFGNYLDCKFAANGAGAFNKIVRDYRDLLQEISVYKVDNKITKIYLDFYPRALDNISYTTVSVIISAIAEIVDFGLKNIKLSSTTILLQQ